MVGQRFGKQVVVREVGKGYVEVLCDCGRRKRTRKQYLESGESKSCGCGRYAQRAGTKPVVLGEVIGDLVVEQHLGTNGHAREILVRCSCGVRKVVREDNLRSGEVTSCGCYRRFRATMLNLTHGQSGSKRTQLYRAWESMWRRTRNDERYPTYVRRGIKVHPKWKTFEKFRDYVEQNLGVRPKGGTLDRIENDKGYVPGNIRWASAKAQARNRSTNTVITVGGITLCIAAWAERTGVTAAVICARRKRGWSDKDAVTTPSRPYREK